MMHIKEFYCYTVAYLGFHFGGGGSKFFWKSGGNLHGAKRHAARGFATCLLGVFKNGAIWCVLESILLKFCHKNNF